MQRDCQIMIDCKTAVWCGWSHTQPPCSRRVQVPRSIIIQPCLLVQLLGVKQVGRSPTAISFFHKHLAVRNIHHILGDAAVKVSHHGGTAKVVGMVEVEGWCRVGCGLGAQVSKQLQITAVAAERLVVHVVVEKSGMCCSRSNFLRMM